MIVDQSDNRINVNDENCENKNEDHFLDVLDDSVQNCSNRPGNENEHD